MKIIVVGEICTDVFIYGDCKRLCPEGPVPVFSPMKTTSNVGMAGNVLKNLSAIDPNVDVDLITDNLSKIIKTRYVDEKTNHMFIRVDEGEDDIIPLRLSMSDIIRIKQSDGIIVSDYNKHFLSESTIVEIGAHSRFSILDGKGIITPVIVKNFDFIKINEHEFEKNKDMLSDFTDKVIITLGKNGAKYKNKNYDSPSPRETIDVSGAGDTFVAAFTLKYLETKDIEESIRFANWKSSIVVTKRGVATP